eukprot:3623602-Amphidinium_carterae.1
MGHGGSVSSEQKHAHEGFSSLPLHHRGSIAQHCAKQKFHATATAKSRTCHNGNEAMNAKRLQRLNHKSFRHDITLVPN